MSLDYESVKDFIDYVIGDEDDERFDEKLPFGGLASDAPEEAQKAYDEYVRENEKLKEQGIKI